MELKTKIIKKPWGEEHIWTEQGLASYLGKRLIINAGHRLSFQYHPVKEETILVVQGILYLYTEGMWNAREPGKLIRLYPGTSYHIPPGLTHRFGANESAVHLIEVSSSTSDIVRLEDDYGRVEP